MANYGSDKANFKIDTITVDKKIATSSNPIHLQFNYE